MRTRTWLAGLAAGAALLAGGSAATAQAAPAAPVAAAATWQDTGQYYTTYSRCMADEDYYMSASNVYDYRCVKRGSLYAGQVYAD